MAYESTRLRGCDDGKELSHLLLTRNVSMHCYVALDAGLLTRLRERTAGAPLRFTCVSPTAAPHRTLRGDELLIVDPLMEPYAYDLCVSVLLQRPVSLLCYTRLSPNAVHRLVALSRIGYFRLILADHGDTPDALLATLADEEAQALSRQVLRVLAPGIGELDEKLAAVLHDLFCRPYRYHTTGDLALAAGVSPAYVYRGCKTAGLSSPKHLVTSARVARVACALLSGHHSIRAVSARTGYTDQRVLRSEIQHVLQCSPRAVKMLSAERVLERLVAFATDGAASSIAHREDETPAKDNTNAEQRSLLPQVAVHERDPYLYRRNLGSTLSEVNVNTDNYDA